MWVNNDALGEVIRSLAHSPFILFIVGITIGAVIVARNN